MSLDMAALPRTIAEVKARLRATAPRLDATFAEAAESLGREAAEIGVRDRDGEQVIPDIAYTDVVAGTVPAETVTLIKRRGVVVVRGVFAQEQAKAWDAELSDYLRHNDYIGKAKRKIGLDKYFSKLKSGRPQIYGIYWSRPQVEARQSESLAATRAWLNHLWRWQGADGAPYFIPDRECTYADRIRQREPGDVSFGLSPHVDGGSVERWIDRGFQHVYRHVFAGDWRAHDPWDGDHRTEVGEIPSPAVARVFRTFQGWTGLTTQGRDNGTLKVIPMTNAVVYLLLRALRDDVPEQELCGAEPGRALWVGEKWHAALMPALVSIPTVHPGDTVWWHPDVVHSVEDVHRGTSFSNVMYIGAAPDCAKNRAFLDLQKAAFLEGHSCPDFAAEDYEVDFTGRAGLADLTSLGRRQMGFEAW